MNQFWSGFFSCIGTIAFIISIFIVLLAIIKRAVFIRYLFTHNCFQKGFLLVEIQKDKDPIFELRCAGCLNKVRYDLKTMPQNYLDFFKKAAIEGNHATIALHPVGHKHKVLGETNAAKTK